MGMPEHYQLYLVYASMARELGFCVCHPVPSTLQGLRVSRLLEQFILGEEALWRALVSTHQTPLGLCVRYMLGLPLHHRPYSTLRRRDNTDGRNSFESIFFNGDMSGCVHTLWRSERHHCVDTADARVESHVRTPISCSRPWHLSRPQQPQI